MTRSTFSTSAPTLPMTASSAVLASLRPRSPGLGPSGSSSTTRRPITNPSDGSLLLNLPAGAYRGYTPSGGSGLGPGHSHRQSQSQDAMSHGAGQSMVSDLSTLSWHTLDPVFYADEARKSFGRRDKTGVVRTRRDPPGFRRKLLTIQGHPGVFSCGEYDDFSLETSSSKLLGNTL
eukprot:gene14452-30760_t